MIDRVPCSRCGASILASTASLFAFLPIGKAIGISGSSVREGIRSTHEKGCFVIQERSKNGHLARVLLPAEAARQRCPAADCRAISSLRKPGTPERAGAPLIAKSLRDEWLMPPRVPLLLDEVSAEFLLGSEGIMRPAAQGEVLFAVFATQGMALDVMQLEPARFAAALSPGTDVTTRSGKGCPREDYVDSF